MKTPAVFLVAVLLAASLHAQSFEGTVTWKMRAEITDPDARQQMQSAQAQMATPEMQASLREAQAALQTPEMQAMMKQNPQMRALLEQQMSAFQAPSATADGGGFERLFPTRFTLHAKGTRTLVKIEGGMVASEVLTLGGEGFSYQLNRDKKTYRRLPKATVSAGPAPTFKITRTAEQAKVLGYNCTRCLVETQGGAERATYSVWVTKEIKGLDPKQLDRLQVGRESGANFMSQLDGVPMRMDITTPQAKLAMEVSEIREEALAEAIFMLPPGFTETAN